MVDYGLTDYMSLAEFRGYFPEFRTMPDSNADFYLEVSKSKINKSVWKEQTKMGHGLWTAHLIAMSPFGINLRLQNNEGVSDYKAQYDELAKSFVTTFVTNSGI